MQIGLSLVLLAYDIDNSQGGPRFTYNYDKSIFYFYEWLDNNDNPSIYELIIQVVNLDLILEVALLYIT